MTLPESLTVLGLAGLVFLLVAIAVRWVNEKEER